MTLFVIVISAVIAVAAYKYNNWYIAQEQANASIEDTAETQEQMRLSREDWANRLVCDIKSAQAEKEAPIRNRKAERLQFSVDAADEEIEVAMTRRDKLIALYDCKAAELESVTPNGKEWQKIQKSLLTYENQLNTVEKRISKAQFTRKQALAELKEIA